MRVRRVNYKGQSKECPEFQAKETKQNIRFYVIIITIK